MSAVVSTTDLLVRYRTPTGTITALRHPSLSVAAGASVAVMGPSGSGKSTLLGLLAGLAVPTAGSVSLDGTTISEVGEPERVRLRRDLVGMVYQADNLLPYLTAEENVVLPLRLGGRPDGEHPRRLLDRLGLGDLHARLPDELSGGQRQRVAVARAVVGRPRLILADEPTGALDEVNARGVVELLVGVQRRLGAAMVLVTHDPDIAGRCDRVVTLHSPVDAHDEQP